MDWDIETSIDDNRLKIRRVLLEAVKKLNKEDGFSLRDIVAEMLVISSMVVSDENCEIIESNINQDFEDTDNEDEFQIMEPREKEFNETEISCKWWQLHNEWTRNFRLNHYEEALNLSMEFLNIMPEYYETMISMRGYCYGRPDYEFRSAIDYAMKACVVLMDQEKMDNIITIAKKLHSITGEKKKDIDIEIIEHNFNLYNNDICIVEKIYDFLKSHQKYLQKNINKALSISGKKSAYIFEYAEKFGKISRIKHGDSWQLTYLA